MLAYLAVEQAHPHRREALAGLFWPGYMESSARASLRHCLANLRQVLAEESHPTPYLEVEGEVIRFNPASDHWLDVESFRSLVEEEQPGKTTLQRLEEAIRLYQGAFLEGLALKDSPEFDNWLSIQRENLQQLALTALYRLAEEVAAQGELEKACKLARRQLELEASREEAHQQLMRLLAMHGQRAAALAQYETYRHILKTELGVEPSPATILLYEQIRSGEVGPPASPHAPEAEQHLISIIQPQPRHNLPAQLTSFIGREKEIAQVKELLAAHRLVTLTGAGGVGKTRLALQVAEGMLDPYPDGVWLANLALISDPEQLLSTAGRAMGLQADVGPQAQEKLIEYLQHRQLLLMLDNCEHLVEACAVLAEALLQSCPKVQILATSRERLGIAGELQYYLPSLSVPNMEDQPALEQVSQAEAVRLFAARAALCQPGFSLTAQNAQAIGRLCAQVDGIPLAIELAAGWVRLLPVEQISQRLKENLDFLRGGARTALPRSQTLRGCLDWSYALLSPGEQELLQALSVFVGGWTLEAAEAVCAGSCTSEMDILNLLDLLAGKSLVVVEPDRETELRYRLLEPVRQYAQEKLFQAGKAETLRDQHQTYFQELAAQAAPHLRTHQQITWMRRLERELPNLRQALDWAYTKEGPLERLERGLRLMTDSCFYWKGRLRLVEGIQWFIRLLDLEKKRRGTQPLANLMCLVRANALVKVVILFQFLYKGAVFFHFIPENYLEESKAIFIQVGEVGRHGLALVTYTTTLESNDLGHIETKLEKILPEFEALGDKFWMAECLVRMGLFAAYQNKIQLAEKYWKKSLQISLEAGDLNIIPYQKINLAKVAYDLGDLEKAKDWAAQSRQNLVEIETDFLDSANANYLELGSFAWLMGDYAQAESDLKLAIELSERIYKVNRRLILILLYISQGEYNKAGNLLEDLVSSTPYKDMFFEINVLGEFEWGKRNYARARQIFNGVVQKINLQELPIVDLNFKVYAELGLAKVALSEEYWHEAAQHLYLALELQNQLPFLGIEIYEDRYAGVTLTAILAFSLGYPDITARLFGTGDSTYQKYRLTFPLYRRQFYEQAMEAARAALNEADYAKAWEEGQALDIRQALEYALSVVKEFMVEIESQNRS
jgi:predicted ATPase/DNA-binding SARP family transcriptional activator